MAKNGAKGSGRRGGFKGTEPPGESGLWVHRDPNGARFLHTRRSGGSFKGVKREK